MEFGEALTKSGPRVGAEMLRHAQNGSGTCRHKYAEAYNRPPAPLMRKVATNLSIADTRNRRRCRRRGLGPRRVHSGNMSPFVKYLPKLVYWLAALLLGGLMLIVAGIAGAYIYLQPSLPSVEAMRRIELQVPLRVYSSDGKVIAQIGEQRRNPVSYEQIPELVKQAFIAAEDDRFFEHAGFDYQGILRSIIVNLIPGYRLEGASTITQQTAKNLFLTNDRTWRGFSPRNDRC